MAAHTPTQPTDWKSFLLGIGKFNEDTHKSVFEMLAKAMALPHDLIEVPQESWDGWLIDRHVTDSDIRLVIKAALARLKDANNSLVELIRNKWLSQFKTLNNTPPLVLSQDEVNKIVDREEAITKLQAAVNSNMEKINSKDKAFLKIATAFGFVGIGKTTVGRLGQHLTFNNKPVVFVSIDLSSEPLSTNNFRQEFGLILLARLFCNLSVASMRSTYPKFFTSQSLMESITFEGVLSAYATLVLPSGPHAFVLHLDEINAISEEKFQLVLSNFSTYMLHESKESIASTLQFGLLPILTGVSSAIQGPLSISKFGEVNLPLPSLSLQASCDIVLNNIDHFSQITKNALRHNLLFMRIIKSAGGVPRPLVSIRNALQNTPELDLSITEDLLKRVAHIAIAEIKSTYKIETWANVFGNKGTFYSLLWWCLRGGMLKRDDQNRLYGESLDGKHMYGLEVNGKNASFDRLEQGGFLFRQHEKLTIPYIILMCIAATPLVSGAISDVLVSPASEFHWQTFEDLELHFLQTLLFGFQAVGIHTAKLGDIWRGAQGNQELLSLQVQIPSVNEINIQKETEMWLHKVEKKKRKSTNENKSAAPKDPSQKSYKGKQYFLKQKNLFTKTEVGLVNASVKRAIFKCQKNTPLIDCRHFWTTTAGTIIHIVEQLKMATVPAKEKQNPELLLSWYQSAVASIGANIEDNIKVVYIFFCTFGVGWTAEFSQEKVMEQCPNLLLIEGEHVSTYLSSIFAPIVGR